MARAARRRHAEEALDDERQRAAGIQAEIERLIAELEGPQVDEDAFARMAPEDAALVRGLLREPELPEDEAVDDIWPLGEDEEGSGEPPDLRAEVEEEIVRLQAELAASRRTQEALERYLEAVGHGPAG